MNQLVIFTSLQNDFAQALHFEQKASVPDLLMVLMCKAQL